MVLADGTFDMIHLGHIRYLQAAAMLGSPLFVRVASDVDIEAKGRRPFQTQHERVLTVNAIGCVDCAFPGGTTLADAVLDWKPAILAKGKDWEGRLPDEVLVACRDMGTRIVYTDTVTQSSTERLSNWRDVWGRR